MEQPTNILEVTEDTTPAAPPATSANNTSGTLLLQWLTYAFWGWTLVALGTLVSVISVTFMTGADAGSIAPYSIAVVAVLLPIAITCELLYRKRESGNKHGVASVIMVIHAVIFALFGAGLLVAFAYTLVNSLVETFTPRTGAILVTVGTMIILYAATFIRTLNPVWQGTLSKIYVIFMTAVGVVALVLGVIGPISQAVQGKDDKLIEDSLGSVQQDITKYANTNDRLPDSLESLPSSGKSKELINKKLVTYKQSGKKQDATAGATEHRYQLCVTYKNASSSSYDSSYVIPAGDYEEYLSAYSHPKGEVCYKLKAVVYSDDYTTEPVPLPRPQSY